jgi:uncharacterized protein YbcI
MPSPERPHEVERREPGGDVRANIARRMVQLHKEFYGRGPEKAKTYYNGDLVVVLMRGGFTRVEETLLKEGRGASVIQQRADFQEVMLHRFSTVIQEETGRNVIAMMSGSHQQPDLLAEVFVLESSEVLSDDVSHESGSYVE